GPSGNPGPSSATTITANVIAMIKSRPGNGVPAAVTVGMAAARTRESAPRRPTHETTAGNRHGGDGSRPRTRRLSKRGREVAGTTHTPRATMTATLTSTAPHATYR